MNEVIDCVENFESYYKYGLDEIEANVYTKKEFAYIWFCRLFATFYDSEMELKWGKLLYETIDSIIDKTQNILMHQKYEEYLICLNLIGIDKLNWGSSIRFCWFDNKEFENKCKDYLKQVNNIKGK